MIRQKILMAAAFIVLCAFSTFHLNAQTITGTLRDSLTGDQNSNGIANPGDSIAYKAKLKNASGGGAVGVQYNNPTPANTQLGTNTRTSALARNDVGAVAFNFPLTGGNVLSNDFGIPTPSVLTYGPTANPAATNAGGTGTTNGGGSIVITSGGFVTYNPLPGYTGNDQFAYIAGNGNLPNNSATVLISVGTPATATNDSYFAVGNVSITLSAALGVRANDGGDATVVETVQGSASNVGVSTNTANSGQVTLNADGSFTYNPPPGFEGTDNFTYTVDNGFNTPASATVNITVAGMIWFVDANAGTNGNGRLTSPFNSLANFQSLNNGVGNNPAANDYIFLYESANPYNNGVSLQAGQKLIGQDATSSLQTITGYSLPSYSATLPAMNSGNASQVTLTTTNAGTDAIVLFINNQVRGLTIGNKTGRGIFGSSFVTFISSDVTITGTGQALYLATGSVSATFDAISSSSGLNGIYLAAALGNMTVNGGSITGSTGASINISAGNINFNYAGSITQAINDALLKVDFGHSGILTFNTGTLSATNGTGLQFDNADGTYNFNGTTSLSGGNSAVVILNGSAGTFSFGSSCSITSPGSIALGIASSTANVTYSGTFQKNAAGAAIVINSETAGTININGTGTKTINSGVANAVNLLNNTGATINFSNGGLSITTTLGIGFNATGGGTINVTGTGNIISSSGGTALNVANTTIGASGLNFQSVSTSGGSVPGIDLNTVSGTGSVIISGGNIVGGAATAINITAGTVSLTYSGSASQPNASQALVNVSSGHTGTLTFNTGTLSATNGTGLQFNNADGTYNFNGNTTLNGGAAAVNIINASAGNFSFASTASITSPTDTAFNILGGTASVTYSGNITQANNFPIVTVSQGHNTGTVTFQSGTLSGLFGTGLQFDNADGTYSFNGTTALSGGNTAVGILNGSAGTFSFGSSCSITSPGSIAIGIASSTANVTYSGTFQKNAAGAAIIVNSETGGTININGTGTKTINSGVANAVNLLNNTGATINFSGNNLLITTTSGIGFNATGGGTISVTGTGNTINTSGGGTALNVTSTTIGASNLNFQSISANGGTNGIVLSSTGSGGLSVLGSGSTAGSGGTIQNTSNRGASLINTGSITLKNMNFTNAGNTNLVSPGSGGGGISPGEDVNFNLNANAGIHLVNITGVTLDNINLQGGAQQGINGNNVTNFSLANSIIQGAGDEVREDGLHFKDMFGTSSITNTTFGGSNATTDNAAVQVHIENYSGAPGTKITFSGLNIQSRGFAASGVTWSHGLMLNAQNTANVNFSISNCTINNMFSNSIQAGNEGSGLMEITITGCTFTNVGAGGINIAENGTGGLRYNVHSNGTAATPTFLRGSNNFTAQGININQAGTGTGLMEGAVTNNYIGINGNPTSASSSGYGIRLYTISSGTSTTNISGNVVNGCFGGIDASMGEEASASHTLNATIQNNTCNVPNPLGFDGIHLNAGTLTGDLGTYNLNLSGNVCNSATGNDFNVRQRMLTTMRLLNYSGANNNNTTVQTYIDVTQANNATGANPWFITNNVSGGGGGFQNTVSVPLPTLPTP